MAKKPTVTTLQSGFNSTEVLNQNFEALRDSFDNTLSLDGSTPNAMEADLDLNGNNIIGASGLLINGTDYLADVDAAKAAALVAQAAAELAENNAETAESNAEASETAAANSATSSASSASAASVSATAASASETAAAASEAAASTSETNAAASETAAAASETAAASSASSASTSAFNAASSASSASASADAALAALDNFDDRYLGQKASDPTLDNDGDALVAGALYFNTNAEIMKVFDGSLWVAAYSSLSGAMFGANNLSDVASASDSRANLGLGTAATTASTDYATAAQGSLADSAVQPNDSPTFAGLTAESLGIGTSSPSSKLSVYGDTDAVVEQLLTIVNAGTGVGTGARIWLSGADPTSRGAYIEAATKNSSNAHDLVFATNTSGTAPVEAMRIHSSGKVGIGTSSPTDKLNISSETNQIGLDTGNQATYGTLDIGHFTNGAFIGTQAGSNTASKVLRFGTSGTERLRIDSAGNLLVGTTDVNPANNSGGTDIGTAIRANGQTLAASSGAVHYFNRLSSDGDIAVFRKDGSTVGSIGSRTGLVSTIILDPRSSQGAGLTGASSTLNPVIETGSETDATVSLGSGSYRFKDGYFSGTVNAVNFNAVNFNTTSDATLKTNVETLTGSLDAVNALRGVSFDWIENGGSEVGFIAQEVEEVLPEVVSTNDQGIKSVKYGNMVAVLVEALKEQQAQIDELKSKLEG